MFSSSSSSSTPPPFSSTTTSTTMVLNEIENSKPHVLAVDDSLVDRIIIEKLLINYALTTAENAERALEILGLTEGKETLSDNSTESQVNMIITDYCMPGMSGYELLKKIKESPAMKEIPVIVVSSDNIPTRITKCLEEGAQEFLLKPLKQSDVKKLSCHLDKLKNLCNEMFCAVTPIN